MDRLNNWWMFRPVNLHWTSASAVKEDSIVYPVHLFVNSNSRSFIDLGKFSEVICGIRQTCLRNLERFATENLWFLLTSEYLDFVQSCTSFASIHKHFWLWSHVIKRRDFNFETSIFAMNWLHRKTTINEFLTEEDNSLVNCEWGL